jgi:hypothetical protein
VSINHRPKLSCTFTSPNDMSSQRRYQPIRKARNWTFLTKDLEEKVQSHNTLLAFSDSRKKTCSSIPFSANSKLRSSPNTYPNINSLLKTQTIHRMIVSNSKYPNSYKIFSSSFGSSMLSVFYSSIQWP